MELASYLISKIFQERVQTDRSLLNIEIECARLLLKSISLAYKKPIFDTFTEEITTYMYPRPAKNIAETASFIKNSLEGMKNEHELILVILKKDSQEFLGCAGIHRINSKHPEFGIWLKKTAHHHGYGLETVTAMKNWCEENLDCEYFTYPVDEENYPSRRIPEKLGGEIVRTYQKRNLSGRILNLVEYKIQLSANSEQ
ncbi:GNAT family N-acetyltransferase [Calothrix sp. CCY 0018]|uniref:GNAT family N-acetyltransferase n=1 Tax=Calothrix sp. CCY 0018 TaxID=3103864 RepID=UPI0039C620BF